ncbi:BCL2/adenovirus E1B 19 kDa protein-interacting protein 2 isoform X2 [Polyodon spathula]|uniref:BCL2/adenovirus E1B 19 kDa protein-interacting protein 2 isoform X2 n=1 Tax=Polyodon spathula TaxID=7913 RepID=UPI001B7EEFF0|nr:BCL2/adenovirus E1B 19 kDa protein-interacting protein 2 isoform X2 [Polyodon spathula]
MAAEALESQAVVGDIGLTKNISESDSDTPRLVVSQTVEPMPPAATLTPDQVSESPLHRMSPASVSADGAALATPTKTAGPLQEAAVVRTSTPGRSYEPLSSEQNGSLLERQESVATTEARLRMEGVELKEEWQDEDFPRPLPEEEDIHMDGELFTACGRESHPVPQSFEANGDKKARKKLVAPNISLTLNRSDGSLLSDELEESGELELDDMDTPSDNSNEFEWEDDLPKPKMTEVLRKGVDSIQEYSSTGKREEGWRWRVFRIGDQDHRVDMKTIEPYKRVISHGGYYGDGLNAIIVFAVCFMPEGNLPNYRYIMDNLFKYVIGTLELLVAENYMIVYLNGATTRRKMPSLGWLRKCYQQIDRRLRKNLKSLIIVHPSWFIRTLLAVTRPFISTKFSQKIKYVFTLTELAELVPMEYVSIPECIKQYEEEKFRKTRKRLDKDMLGKQETAAAQQ